MPDERNSRNKSDFLSTAAGNLQSSVNALLTNSFRDNPEMCGTVYSLLQSLKNFSASYHFEFLHSLTGEIEHLVSLVNQQKTKPSLEQTEVIFKSLDLVNQIMQGIEQHSTDTGYEEYSYLIAHSLKDSVRNILTAKDSKTAQYDEKQMLSAVENGILNTFAEEALALCEEMEIKIRNSGFSESTVNLFDEFIVSLTYLNKYAEEMGHRSVYDKIGSLVSCFSNIKTGSFIYNESVKELLLQELSDLKNLLGAGSFKGTA